MRDSSQVDAPEHEEFLQRIRALYDDYPAHQVPAPLLPAAKPARHRRVRVVAATVAVAGAVALVPVVATLLPSGPSQRLPAAGDGPAATSSPELTPGEPGADERLVTALYRVLDGDPGYGFYLLALSAGERTVTLYRNHPDSSLEERAGAVAAAAGYRLVTSPLPPTPSEAAQRKVSAVANQVRRALEGSSRSGFATLKEEVALNTVVAWRTTAVPEVDAEVTRIGQQAGVEVELRAAPVSQADARELGQRLRQDAGQRSGFTVNGAYATGSGTVVVVRGNADAARRELTGRHGIIAVEEDRMADLPGVITPKPGS